MCVDPTQSYNIPDVDELVSGRLETWLAKEQHLYFFFRFALLTMLVTCSDHDSFADRVTPKYFADDNFSSGV